ncbi:MAG TPA: class I SAM-dependent methyltransferase [Candidatus Nanoarchaeia archaeon]|nr:class I SAM-dependent methyltransferase [Candidatus Nanoarchaeia archaeon]
MASDGRFEGIIGDEYEIFRKALPHYDELQEGVGLHIAEHLSTKSIQEPLILEIGCGTGHTTEAILRSNPTARVISIDNEPKMMEVTTQRLHDYVSAGRLIVLEHDALYHLQFIASNFIDAIASAFTIHNFPKHYRNHVLTLAYRALKHGGMFINADKYVSEDSSEHVAAFEAEMRMLRDTADAAGIPELYTSWYNHYLEDEKPERIMRESESIAQLKKIGFMDVRKTYRHLLEAIVCARK